jgi:hypothetical protein
LFLFFNDFPPLLPGPVSNCSDKKPPSTMFGQVFTPKIESDKHALKETKLKVTTSESTKDSVDAVNFCKCVRPRKNLASCDSPNPTFFSLFGSSVSFDNVLFFVKMFC